MEQNIETAVQVLRDEFDSCPYVAANPMGNAATSRKIRDVITRCILANRPVGEAKELLRPILNGADVPEAKIAEVEQEVDSCYYAKDLIDKGYRPGC